MQAQYYTFQRKFSGTQHKIRGESNLFCRTERLVGQELQRPHRIVLGEVQRDLGQPSHSYKG
jgi:hypothetical protein